MRELNQPLEDLKDKYLNQESLQIWKDLDIMKLLLKSTKENYNKGEKQEEDNLKVRFNLTNNKLFSRSKKFNFVTLVLLTF